MIASFILEFYKLYSFWILIYFQLFNITFNITLKKPKQKNPQKTHPLKCCFLFPPFVSPSFYSTPCCRQYTHCTNHWYIIIHSLSAHSQYYVSVELTVGRILSWIYHPHKRIIIVLYFKKGRKKPYKLHHSAMNCFCMLNL